MMKRLLLSAVIALCCFSGFAQVRYLDEVFTTVSVDSNIVYGANKGYYSGFNAIDSLKMDVYTPDGDTATARPIIILAHAGSFLPPGVSGFDWANKNQNCIVELCKRYAKRGYVAVSMTYRLGWNPTAGDQETRAKTIIQAVYRSMQDMKNCVRYFRDSEANGNPFKVDASKVIVGGTNSGAYSALACSNLNKASETQLLKFLDGLGNSFIDTLATGNFEGFGGTQNLDNYPGYSSAVTAVLSLGGAVGDSSWIEAGEAPIIAFQGVNETLTPYNTAVVTTTTFAQIVEVSGSGDFMPRVDRLNNNNGFSPNTFAVAPPNKNGAGVITTSIDGLYPFYGQGFEPWSWYNGANPAINPAANMTKAMKYIDTIMGYATPRIYKLMIDPTYGEPNGLGDSKATFNVGVYPNPADASTMVYINSVENKPIQTMELYDISGRLVKQFNNIDTHYFNADLADVLKGAYIVKLTLTDGKQATQKLMIQ
jgi:hypothetical protein